MTDTAALADLIRSRAGDAPVALGLILGSGLGHLAHAVDGVAIPYADLPGFPHVGVSGHNPNLHVGTLEGVRVAVFGAREHYYESGNPRAMLLPLQVLKALWESGPATVRDWCWAQNGIHQTTACLPSMCGRCAPSCCVKILWR